MFWRGMSREVCPEGMSRSRVDRLVEVVSTTSTGYADVIHQNSSDTFTLM